MAHVAPLARMTYSEYLAFERADEVRHEYLRGEVFALAGRHPEPSRLAANLIRVLGEARRGRPCAVFTSDAHVRIEATDRSASPDVSVVCGRLENAPGDLQAIVNPVILVEVLSDASPLT